MMKKTTRGKRLSRRTTTTIESLEDIDNYAKAHGRPNANGGYTMGLSFDDEVKSYSESAKAFLEKQGLPSSRLLFKTTSSPKRYIDSTAPEDVERAQEAHRRLCEDADESGVTPPEGGLPTIGKCLDPTINVTWEEQRPEDDCCLGWSSLSHYMQNEKGFAHDALETLAADIIELCHSIAHGDASRVPAASLRLGRRVTLFRVYHRDRAKQTPRAKKSRNPDMKEIIGGLAAKPGTAKELWPKLFGKMNEAHMQPEECPLTNDRYFYELETEDKRRKITLRTFANRLSEARNKRKSR